MYQDGYWRNLGVLISRLLLKTILSLSDGTSRSMQGSTQEDPDAASQGQQTEDALPLAPVTWPARQVTTCSKLGIPHASTFCRGAGVICICTNTQLLLKDGRRRDGSRRSRRESPEEGEVLLRKSPLVPAVVEAGEADMELDMELDEQAAVPLLQPQLQEAAAQPLPNLEAPKAAVDRSGVQAAFEELTRATRASLCAAIKHKHADALESALCKSVCLLGA